MANETPMQKAFREAKEKHPDMLLLYRMGDFYESFGDDARKLHDVTGLTLCEKSNLACCGFHYKELERHVQKLLHNDTRVAICDPISTQEENVQ